jgi:TPR repeat protein
MRLRGAMRAVAVLVCMAVMVSAEDDDLTVSDEGGAELAEPIEPAEPAEPASADVDRAETIHSEGLVKLRGLGGERQHVGAGIEILKEAVKAGSGGAGYDLALFYEEAGTGFTDVNEALKYYTAAADEGHAAAQSALAHMYDTGIGGVEPDPAKATLYHYFASTGGNVASLMALGYKHMHGIGVPKSCDTAFSYYNPAAELVINEAQVRATHL